MVCEGLVTINDFQAETDQRVFKGQTVSIRLIEPPDKLLEAQQASLNVVWEDPWLMVLNKPVGVVAHPVGEFQDSTLCNAIQSHLDSQTVAAGILRPGIVHRLDRMTSGLIVIAKEHTSHRLLSLDFQAGRPQKSYLAIVAGCPEFEQKRIELPIGIRDGDSGVLMSARASAQNPRKARTDITVRQRFENCSLVECRLYTGRNHQIRVHMAEIGHPVLGDEFYAAHGEIIANPRANGAGPTRHRHALHASQLGFRHPILQQDLKFQIEPGTDFWAFLNGDLA